MHHGEIKASGSREEQVDSAASQKDLILKDMYRKAVDKEIEISDIKSTIDILNYEKESINQDELIAYRQFREEKTTEESIAIIASGNAGGIGLLTGIASGSTLLTIGAFALGGALFGVGAIALSGYIKNNWLNPINIEYKDVPFVEAKLVYSGGKFSVIESKPEQGIYRAQFYPEVSSYATLKLEILVKKKIVPRNAKRVEEINKEIEEHQQSLKIKNDELAVLNQQRKSFIEDNSKVLEEAARASKEAGRRKRLDLFSSKKSAVYRSDLKDRMAKLKIPLASDGEGIVEYLEQIKKLEIPIRALA